MPEHENVLPIGDLTIQEGVIRVGEFEVMEGFDAEGQIFICLRVHEHVEGECVSAVFAFDQDQLGQLVAMLSMSSLRVNGSTGRPSMKIFKDGEEVEPCVGSFTAPVDHQCVVCGYVCLGDVVPPHVFPGGES